MTDPDLVRVGPDEWQTFRDVRLASLADAQADDHVELISMWVAPDHRGTGLAGRLVEQVAGWASSNGHDTFLMVRDDNERAARAYEKAGFVDLGVPEDWPDDAPRERRMRRACRGQAR